MASIRPCNKCGQRISLRQMPAGQWVAFNAATNEQHVCTAKKKTSKKDKVTPSTVYSSATIDSSSPDQINDTPYKDENFENELKEIERLRSYNNNQNYTQSSKEEGIPKWVFVVGGLILLYILLKK